MKERKPGTNLTQLTGLLGLTRQSYYQYFRNQQELKMEHQIKMGRDALFNLMAENYMLIRRRHRRSMLTADSRHWLKR